LDTWRERATGCPWSWGRETKVDEAKEDELVPNGEKESMITMLFTWSLSNYCHES
jgi:hypothetical protein